jgi:predicted XRE-type DNA-binding protein
MTMKEGEDFHVSSGNVFADLDHPEPEEALAKAKLAYVITTIILELGWSQARAAEALGVDQPKVSALLTGRLRGFSTERLIRFLNALDHDVEISVRPKRRPGKDATIEVVSPLIPAASVRSVPDR